MLKRFPLPIAFPEKYSDVLNFEVGYTISKGYHVIVGSKVCHFSSNIIEKILHRPLAPARTRALHIALARVMM